jgi:type IV secretory pathway VirB2 component (pilin)
MISGPTSSSSIVASVTWIEHALLGTAATAIAVICIAGLGYTFLAGRIPVRRAVTVMIGCFILFGAPSIAAGLSALVTREPPPALMGSEPVAPQFAVAPQTSSRTAPDPFNPYPGE